MPLSPAPPPPPKGEGEETRLRFRRGTRSRGAGAGWRVSGPRPPWERAEGGHGAPAPQPSAQPTPPVHNRCSTDPGTWLEFSEIKVHLVLGASPTPQSPGKFGSWGSPRGSDRSLCSLPSRLLLHTDLGARLGVSAPGRERRPGGPRLWLVPSPSLPSPAGGNREEGAVGRAVAECWASG